MFGNYFINNLTKSGNELSKIFEEVHQDNMSVILIKTIH